MSDEKTAGFWAIVELLGHVRMAGYVTEESHWGAAVGRVDIPGPNGPVTQFFGGGSIYRVTPTTEEVATRVAAQSQSAPIHLWELPQLEKQRYDGDEE